MVFLIQYCLELFRFLNLYRSIVLVLKIEFYLLEYLILILNVFTPLQTYNQLNIYTNTVPNELLIITYIKTELIFQIPPKYKH